ncbi:MAG: CbbQ/NirQ/NorQ/GpvN family protein [Spongiibacteraceae bacterium]
MNSLSEYLIADEPHYYATGSEIAVFEQAHREKLPLMLKGPTGCGKTRFVEYMAWRLQRPLITIACHEDMTAADLVGRHLLNNDGTHWQDGPLTRATRAGAICYLDEIVEAHQDTVVVIHPLTDARRLLPLERNNELVHAHPDFQLVVSYNPGYQHFAKQLKESTKQRFVALDFQWPEPAVEAQIIVAEADVDNHLAETLVTLAAHSRNLVGKGLAEGFSTRMLIHAARLARNGLGLRDACLSALILPITDDVTLRATLLQLFETCR